MVAVADRAADRHLRDAYLIVDVPRPGDIRTNQVSTILAGDGSELAKIVPPEGNRVDVNIDQIPVHVRDAVMAAEDRDFYSIRLLVLRLRTCVQEQHLRRRSAGRITITQQYVKNALVGDARSGLVVVVAEPKSWSSRPDVRRMVQRPSAAVVSETSSISGGRVRHRRVSKAYFDKPVEQLTARRARCWLR